MSLPNCNIFDQRDIHKDSNIRLYLHEKDVNINVWLLLMSKTMSLLYKLTGEYLLAILIENDNKRKKRVLRWPSPCKKNHLMFDNFLRA